MISKEPNRKVLAEVYTLKCVHVNVHDIAYCTH